MYMTGIQNNESDRAGNGPSEASTHVKTADRDVTGVEVLQKEDSITKIGHRQRQRLHRALNRHFSWLRSPSAEAYLLDTYLAQKPTLDGHVFARQIGPEREVQPARSTSRKQVWVLP